MQKETKYVLIIGSSNMDLNIYSKKFPNPGETVTGGTFKQFFGGKGANQAVAAVRSGAKTTFIGKIGVDSFGDEMITRLSKENINIDHVIRDPQIHSGVAIILIDENGENMISVAPGANYNLNPEEIRSREDIVKNATSLVVQMEIPIETIQEIFRIASEGSPIKILNPAPMKLIPPGILENIDILVPNEGELYRLHSLLGFKKLTGKSKEKIIQASIDISDFGLDYILVTLGKKGCIIFDRKQANAIEIPAPKVTTVDTVGAGDCFIGILASRLSKGDTITNAVKFSTIGASIAVTRKGAQESIPYLKEIEDRINELNLNHD